MNLMSLLTNNDSLRAPLWKGTWARLWIKPSIFSAQTFIVGLAVLDETGLCDYRFINDTSKFECIYGESGRVLVDQLLAEAQQRLGHAREQHLPLTTMMLPPGFEVEPVGYISGASYYSAMEDALNEAEIPMEPKQDTIKSQRFKSRKSEEVTNAIINEVKNKLGLRAEQFIRNTVFGHEKHTAHINLVLPKSAGMIASGWYSEAHRVQLALLKAVTAVETYTAQSNKNGKPGVFFLRPTVESGLRQEQSKAIENALDDVDWQLGKKGLRVAVREFEHDLAEDVAEWVDA